MGGKKRKARAKKTSTKKRKEKRVRKRKMARVKKKKRGMTKFSFVTQPRHFVLHIPNTPPHHHLCSFDEKKGARRDRLRQFEIYPNPTVRKTPKKIPIQRAKCQTNPPSKKNDRTSRYKTNKNIAKRWCFLSKKQKRILSSPFKNKTKNFPYQIERKNKTLHYSVLVSLS